MFEIRQVNVPDDEWNDSPSPLDLVFYYGQNDVQPVPDRCSVSMGDVILFNGSPCLVIRNGFKEITLDELERYKATPRLDREMMFF